jgi:hypothetical protein
MRRVEWESLPDDVRDAVEARTGPALKAETIAEGLNSAVAMRVSTTDSTLFVKGLRSDHPGVVTLHREAAINPYVLAVAPRLRWQVEVGGWHLLGFDHVQGRHADYSPGSGDRPAVIAALRRLAALPCPDLPLLKRAEQRWAEHISDDPDLLRGDTLLHTDYNPLNILISDDATFIIDWAWPTRGAAWIDPACLVLRLIAAGHEPRAAEAVVSELPAWQTADGHAVDVFVAASVDLWSGIARNDPQPWKLGMASAATAWLASRGADAQPL